MIGLKDGYHHKDDYNSRDDDWWAKVFVSKFRMDATDWSSYLKFETDKQTKMMHNDDAWYMILDVWCMMYDEKFKGGGGDQCPKCPQFKM